MQVEEAELIKRTQVGGRTNPLGSDKRLLNSVEVAELFIEIQIRRKFIFSIASPVPTPRTRENTYKQEFSSLENDQRETGEKQLLDFTALWALILRQTYQAGEAEKSLS